MTYATAILLLDDQPGAAAGPTLTRVGGRPLLAHRLDHLATQGITEVIVAAGALTERVEEIFGNKYAGMLIRCVGQDRPGGSGAALLAALREHNSSQPVWVMEGAVYFSCDLLALALVHEANTADVTLALARLNQVEGRTVVRLARKSNAGGSLVDALYRAGSIAEANTPVSTGYYLLNPAAFQRFDLPDSFSLKEDFLAKYLEDLRLIGALTEGPYFDLSYPGDQARAEVYFQHNAEA